MLDETLEYTNQIIVVNDGSTDETKRILQNYKNLDVISLPENKGKGFALRSAFKFAIEKGFKYAITIDSDGQHLIDDIPILLEKLETESKAIIIGARNMTQDSVPRKSNFGRKFSNFWFKVETGLSLPDTQSGFRLYSLDIINDINLFTNKFEFEIEVLVRAAWKGYKIIAVPVRVFYAPKELRISHFRPFVDFGRISILNTILVLLALMFFRPLLFFKKIKKKGLKNFFRQHFVNSNSSNLNLALSVAVGVFTGVLPIWGYQLVLAIALAIFFKLNKIITIVAANISLPPMIPIIIYGSFSTGKLILGNSAGNLIFSSHIDFEFIKNNIYQYVVGSVALSIILAILFGSLTYLILLIFRKRKVVQP